MPSYGPSSFDNLALTDVLWPQGEVPTIYVQGENGESNRTCSEYFMDLLADPAAVLPAGQPITEFIGANDGNKHMIIDFICNHDAKARSIVAQVGEIIRRLLDRTHLIVDLLTENATLYAGGPCAEPVAETTGPDPVVPGTTASGTTAPGLGTPGLNTPPGPNAPGPSAPGTTAPGNTSSSSGTAPPATTSAGTTTAPAGTTTEPGATSPAPASTPSRVELERHQSLLLQQLAFMALQLKRLTDQLNIKLDYDSEDTLIFQTADSPEIVRGDQVPLPSKLGLEPEHVKQLYDVLASARTGTIAGHRLGDVYQPHPVLVCDGAPCAPLGRETTARDGQLVVATTPFVSGMVTFPNVPTPLADALNAYKAAGYVLDDLPAEHRAVLETAGHDLASTLVMQVGAQAARTGATDAEVKAEGRALLHPTTQHDLSVLGTPRSVIALRAGSLVVSLRAPASRIARPGLLQGAFAALGGMGGVRRAYLRGTLRVLFDLNPAAQRTFAYLSDAQALATRLGDAPALQALPSVFGADPTLTAPRAPSPPASGRSTPPRSLSTDTGRSASPLSAPEPDAPDAPDAQGSPPPSREPADPSLVEAARALAAARAAEREASLQRAVAQASERMHRRRFNVYARRRPFLSMDRAATMAQGLQAKEGAWHDKAAAATVDLAGRFDAQYPKDEAYTLVKHVAEPGRGSGAEGVTRCLDFGAVFAASDFEAVHGHEEPPAARRRRRQRRRRPAAPELTSLAFNLVYNDEDIFSDSGLVAADGVTPVPLEDHAARIAMNNARFLRTAGPNVDLFFEGTTPTGEVRPAQDVVYVAYGASGAGKTTTTASVLARMLCKFAESGRSYSLRCVSDYLNRPYDLFCPAAQASFDALQTTPYAPAGAEGLSGPHQPLPTPRDPAAAAHARAHPAFYAHVLNDMLVHNPFLGTWYLNAHALDARVKDDRGAPLGHTVKAALAKAATEVSARLPRDMQPRGRPEQPAVPEAVATALFREGNEQHATGFQAEFSATTWGELTSPERRQLLKLAKLQDGTDMVRSEPDAVTLTEAGLRKAQAYTRAVPAANVRSFANRGPAQTGDYLAQFSALPLPQLVEDAGAGADLADTLADMDAQRAAGSDPSVAPPASGQRVAARLWAWLETRLNVFRRRGNTGLNKTSSRSHVLFVFTDDAKLAAGDPGALFVIADFAGTEDLRFLMPPDAVATAQSAYADLRGQTSKGRAWQHGPEPGSLDGLDWYSITVPAGPSLADPSIMPEVGVKAGVIPLFLGKAEIPAPGGRPRVPTYNYPGHTLQRLARATFMADVADRLRGWGYTEPNAARHLWEGEGTYAATFYNPKLTRLAVPALQRESHHIMTSLRRFKAYLAQQRRIVRDGAATVVDCTDFEVDHHFLVPYKNGAETGHALARRDEPCLLVQKLLCPLITPSSSLVVLAAFAPRRSDDLNSFNTAAFVSDLACGAGEEGAE